MRCKIKDVGWKWWRFDNVSAELRREADMFMSGYLIPHLLPISRAKSAANGMASDPLCAASAMHYDNAKGFGWLRYLTRVDGELWRTDSRDDMSPYNTIFCHDSEYPPEFDTANLTNRNVVIEFQITEGMEAGKHKAVSVQTIRART